MFIRRHTGKQIIPSNLLAEVNAWGIKVDIEEFGKFQRKVISGWILKG